MREVWKDPNHPLRTNIDFKLNSIPTLAIYHNKKVLVKLIDK
jgi:hypothetical protein